MSNDILTPKVLLIADSDSRLKWITGLAAHFPKDWASEIAILPTKSGYVLNERQISSYSERSVDSHIESIDMLKAKLTGAQVVVVCLTASRCPCLITQIRQIHETKKTAGFGRPIIVSGFQGIWLASHWAGLSWRVGSDIIMANSTVDAQKMTEMLKHMNRDPSVVVDAGFVFAQNSIDIKYKSRNQFKNLVFAVQGEFPKTFAQRLWLLEQLQALTIQNPQLNVIVKCRNQKGEVSTHQERYPYDQIVRQSKVTPRPGSFRFFYGSMAEVLKDADALISISSTAAVDAWAQGIPAYFLNDFGFEDAYGSPHFIGSNAFVSLNQVARLEFPEVSKSWISANGFGEKSRIHNVIAKISELLQKQHEQRSPLAYQPTLFNQNFGTFCDLLQQEGLDTFSQDSYPKFSRLKQLLKNAAWEITPPIVNRFYQRYS